ncbi:MAG: hypothetical protein ACRD0J_12115 [Acidimicrobiales bacterium]
MTSLPEGGETAIAISAALGTSAELWMSLQAAFRLHEGWADAATEAASSVKGVYARGMARPGLAQSDPELVARARALADAMAAHGAMAEADRTERDLMVAELRQAGWGYDRIAMALGVTKTRVAQLVKAGLPELRKDSS